MIRPAALALILVAAASPAFAHPLPGDVASFAAGLSHPFGGLDHLLAMLAVGLWAAHLGGRALLAVPASFVAVMTAGFALALGGMPLPLVEPAILASVVVLGLFVATSLAAPTPVAMALTGLFALAHGHAHGSEFVGAADGPGILGFATGFALAIVLLHAVGIFAGLGLAALPAGALRRGATRLAGLAIAMAGAALAIG
jgi:urease accessory protein